MAVTGRARAPIPVSVLTGFLGAGKTTLLSQLLKSPALADTAVIVNEFGAVSLDHLLIETADETIVELKGGCLCCQIRGDLVATLEDLLRRRDNDRIAPFRRVVIETTGLADPAPVLQAVMAHPYLAMRYALSSVITVVDAVNAMATLDAHRESVHQVAVADRLVLSKTDLALADPALPARLGALNPAAPILDAARGEAIPERLFDCGLYDPSGKAPDIAAWLNADAYRAHDHAHGHDISRHDAHIRAFALTEERAIGREALDLFLGLVAGELGERLLRLKGIVRIAGEDDRPMAIHAVRHVFHPPAFLKEWPDGGRMTRIVLITRDADEGRIAALLRALADDRPADPLGAGNPLATPGGGAFRP